MDKRSYNIFFDLHTVSGIVISVLLYVIFFAGSFAFFRDEINNWERSEPIIIEDQLTLDLNKAITKINDSIPLYGRDITISRVHNERRVNVSLSASKDTLTDNESRRSFFYLNPHTLEVTNYISDYSLGEFLYRLHFFAQIPHPVGYYLSGFTAFFLLFALFTGLLIHWKKIVSNFFLFRPLKKMKTVWTDAHTVLGTIGLPFQIVYAVTGAFFMIKIVLLIPNVSFLYDGDKDKLYEDLGYKHAEYKFDYEQVSTMPNFNDLLAITANRWDEFIITHVHIFNYGDKSMRVAVEGELRNTVAFTAFGGITFDSDGMLLQEDTPYKTATYLDGVKNALYQLHFGDYGGIVLKLTSFVLGLLSCFVILSGVLIWLEAREKKKLPEKKRRFNAHVGYVYLAICLSMFPVTALAFIIDKCLANQIDMDRKTIIYSVYFSTWLLSSLYFWYKKDNYFTNKYCLLSGGFLGGLIPLVNGLTSGNWFWNTFVQKEYDLFIVDALWVCMSAVAIYSFLQLKNKNYKAYG